MIPVIEDEVLPVVRNAAAVLASVNPSVAGALVAAVNKLVEENAYRREAEEYIRQSLLSISQSLDADSHKIAIYIASLKGGAK